MIFVKRYFLLLSLIVPVFNSAAQNLTGTWEGDLGGDQFLQLNIIQTGDKICGYTFDHVKADERSFCKAFFEGRFDKQRKILTIDGKYFLKNSGSHVLMRLSLNYKTVKGAEVLEDRPSPARIFSDFFRDFGIFDDPFQSQATSQYVYIKKVSDQPYEFNDLMRDCIARDKKAN